MTDWLTHHQTRQSLPRAGARGVFERRHGQHRRTNPMKKALIALSVTPLVAACAVGPEYSPPTMALGTQFVGGPSGSLEDPSREPWWEGFHDGYLDTLVERGLKQNLDILTVLSRIEQAEANVRANGGAANFSGGLDASRTVRGGEDLDRNYNSAATLSGTYVIDLFGGNKRGREQAVAQLEAQGFDAGSARLAFLTSLTTNYINARFNQEAAALTRRTIESRQETLRLVDQRRAVGAASQLELVQARADLESAQADLPGFNAGFEAAVFAIATLLAEPAGPILGQMQRGAAQPIPGHRYATGVPADLIRNVPSVRFAERNLAAAVANVGVAEAALYPALSLNGTITTGTTGTWSFGPSINLPIFNRGVLNAQRDASVAAAEEAEIAWRAAVLSAVENVEVGTSAYRNSQRTVASLRRAVASNDEALDLSRETYEAGALTLLDLLDTERNASNQRLSLAAAQRDLANDWISLQIATGRGWRD